MIKFPPIVESSCESGSCRDRDCLPKNKVKLVVKPGVAVFQPGRSIQLVAYLQSPYGEARLFQGLIYTSNNQGVAVVNSLGLVTTVAAGTARIAVSWDDRVAYTNITVVTDLTQYPLAYEICVDDSRSMASRFNSQFECKLDAARRIGMDVSKALNSTRDSVGLIAFSTYANELVSISSTPLTVQNFANVLPTCGKTAFWPLMTAINDNVSSVNGAGVAIIVSDGHDLETKVFQKEALDVASEFKNSGGTIICCGLRAQGEGFEFLQKLATPGFFLNIFGDGDTVVDDATAAIVGLLGYIGGGDIIIPVTEQSPDPKLLDDPEETCVGRQYKATKTVCLSSPSPDSLNLIPAGTDYGGGDYDFHTLLTVGETYEVVWGANEVLFVYGANSNPVEIPSPGVGAKTTFVWLDGFDEAAFNSNAPNPALVTAKVLLVTQSCSTFSFESNAEQSEADEQAELSARLSAESALNLAVASISGRGVQSFAGAGDPTFQHPADDAGVYFDFIAERLIEWDADNGCWLGYAGTGGGNLEILQGVQAFCGSGPPTTQKPANGSGTYYNYTNDIESHWDAKNGCWFGHPGTGGGSIVVAYGVQYFVGSGPPTSQVPANGAGQYFDKTNDHRYNWNGSAWK